jgi:hypothetical protein
MTMNAPDITEGYPSKGSRIGPAWADLWARLVSMGRGDWEDGQAASVAVAESHDLAVTTVRNLLTSAARAGLLEQTYRKVDVPGRGTRVRTHYRIKER